MKNSPYSIKKYVDRGSTYMQKLLYYSTNTVFHKKFQSGNITSQITLEENSFLGYEIQIVTAQWMINCLLLPVVPM